MRKLFLAGAAAAALLAAAPALADDAPPTGPSAEVIVTATALDVARNKTVQGVSVVTRDEVIATMGAGLGETLARQPGVSSTFFGAGASRPIIRGLGEDRIRILSDGIGQIDASAISPDHSAAAEGLEAQKIEILRGPAALAYGGNAIGGVVNVIDGRIPETRPDQPLTGQLYAAGATGLDSMEAAAGATARLGPFLLRAEGFARDSGDFAIPGFALSPAKRAEEIAEGADPAAFARGAAPNSFAQAQSGALGVSVVEDWGFLGVSYRRLEQLYGIPEAAKKEAAEPDAPAAIFDGPRIDLKQNRVDLRGLWQSDGFVRAVRGQAGWVDYRHSEIEETGETGTRFSNEGYEGRIEITHAPIFGLTGVIGFNGFKTDFAAIGDEAFITPTQTTDYGLFLVERFDRDRWALETGARVEKRELQNAANPDRDFTLVSGSLGGSWRPVDAVTLTAYLTSTERAPTETELYANGAHLATAAFEIGDPRLKSERGVGAELGARVSLGRLGLEAHIYRTQFDRFIALTPDGAEEDGLPVFRFTQADATLTGGEIEARFDAIKRDDLNLRLEVGYDVVRGEFDAGGNIPRMPPARITLGADGDVIVAGAKFAARVEWQRIDDQNRVAALEPPTPGADVVHALIRFQPRADSEKLLVLLDARNLTDEEVRVHSSFVKDLLPRPGRSVRLAISSKF
jgi:iron complex outermembrane receptor protein